MSHIIHSSPFGDHFIELIEAEPRSDGFIYAPVFFRTLTLFLPRTATQRASFKRVRQAYDRHVWFPTIGSARAYDYACLTHNALISGQRCSIEYGDVGSDNDREPTRLLDLKPGDTPLLLLTVESINGPTIEELLPRCGGTLHDIRCGMRTLDACRTAARHPGDRKMLDWGTDRLIEAWRLLLEPQSPDFFV